MLRSKDFEALSSMLPFLTGIGLHGTDNAFLLHRVEISKPLRKTIDVEHDKVCQQCDDDDNVDQDSGREFVIDTP